LSQGKYLRKNSDYNKGEAFIFIHNNETKASKFFREWILMIAGCKNVKLGLLEKYPF
jgi:hypothetical protein